MQPLTAVPRDELTAEQVVTLIQDAPGIIIGRGCELVDMNLALIEDISPDFAGGSVSRQSYATLHGTANLEISRDLDWGTAIVRPYMTMSDGATSARFNLGAYFTSVPRHDVGESVPTYAVEGYDILLALDDPVGEAYAVDAGTPVIIAVEDIMAQQGYTQHVIDRSAAALVLPSAMVWPFDEKTTWLTIVNDLLATIGYAGVWSDWDGRLRCQPYQSPSQRRPEWQYSADPYTSMLTPHRSIERDFFKAPNRWVFYRQNNTDGAPPTEGNGLYTYVNEREGDTSVEARGGRVITRPVGVDAADHASLVATATRIIDNDLRIKTSIPAGTAPNPLHWHFDRLELADPALGPIADVLDTAWTLPLDGGDMTHEWTVLGA